MKRFLKFIEDYSFFIGMGILMIFLSYGIADTIKRRSELREQDPILYQAWIKAHNQENLSYEEWKLLRLNGLLPNTK
jgi:hypothetical protein